MVGLATGLVKADWTGEHALSLTRMEPMPPNISAILLAAGLSSRLGRDRNKLLIPLGGVPAVRRVALALTESGAAEVIAVTGHEAPEVEAALAGLGITTIHNPDYETGQASSLTAGLKNAAPGADGFLFVLGDQPLLEARLIDTLIQAFAASRGNALAAAPFFGGRRGNPAIFSANIRGELEALRGDEGARKILDRVREESPDRFLEIEAESEEIFWDMDTDADIEKIRVRIEAP
jgi:molybdenum cofactor cytidylyltransferase